MPKIQVLVTHFWSLIIDITYVFFFEYKADPQSKFHLANKLAKKIRKQIIIC